MITDNMLCAQRPRPESSSAHKSPVSCIPKTGTTSSRLKNVHPKIKMLSLTIVSNRKKGEKRPRPEESARKMSTKS